jgi:hypothetical protein
MSGDNWGPWANAISHAELVSRLRVLRAFIQVYIGKHQSAYKALWLAESGDPAELEAARLEMDRIPALHRRRIEGSYIAHHAFKAPVENGRTAPPKQLENAG